MSWTSADGPIVLWAHTPRGRIELMLAKISLGTIMRTPLNNHCWTWRRGHFLQAYITTLPLMYQTKISVLGLSLMPSSMPKVRVQSHLHMHAEMVKRLIQKSGEMVLSACRSQVEDLRKKRLSKCCARYETPSLSRSTTSNGNTYTICVNSLSSAMQATGT
jgi:hypothetical protein